ncbi:MAG TPA: hypothetical protein VGB69_05010 [Edaphobacter sp.]
MILGAKGFYRRDATVAGVDDVAGVDQDGRKQAQENDIIVDEKDAFESAIGRRGRS